MDRINKLDLTHVRPADPMPLVERPPKPDVPWGVIGFGKGVELGLAMGVGLALLSFVGWLLG